MSSFRPLPALFRPFASSFEPFASSFRPLPASFRRRPESSGVDQYRSRSGGCAAAPSHRPIPSRNRTGADQRGVFAPFIAIIASALLFLGSIAYDGPRLTAARQDALHAANESARVAAATIASGGTLEDARVAADERMQRSRLIYGQPVDVDSMHCAGSRVQVTVQTNYVFRTALGILRRSQPIQATGAAEAYLTLPDGTPSELNYLSECPL